MDNKFLNKLSSFLFYFSIFLFIIAFNFAHNPPSGWYQQFLPNLSNMQISDTYFLDSLTGWIVTGNSMPNDTSGYILKTTNGGDNWQLKYTDYRDFSRVKFLNTNTGFVSGGYANGARIFKSTNEGDNWYAIQIPGGGQIYFDDMSVLNEDTIWVVASNGLVGGVFRTTNGGANWQQQLYLGSQNPNHIYMYNADMGFITNNTGTYLRKTTNSGQNWNIIPLQNGFTDIKFIDLNTGWKCGESDSIKKTTDGGNTWQKFLLPPSGEFINLSVINEFSIINADTIWGVGARGFTSLGFRGLIYKSTNGGQTWGYQLPDTNMINIGRYSYIDFYNESIGWAYGTGSGVHTVTGGDTTFYTGIVRRVSTIPQDFILHQNYPNPFNPRTVIPFSLKKNAFVKLTAYDITGKEVQQLVEGKYEAGEYEVDFMGKFSASGVYFYRIDITGNNSNERFSQTKFVKIN